MSKAQKHYNVLIQVQSQNEAERIISTFRTAGIATRAHRVTSQEDFLESINHDTWHLLILDNRHPEVTLPFSLDTLKKQKICIPSLLLTEDLSAETRDKAFKIGIRDVINKNDDAHFAYAAKREMDGAILRLHTHTIEKELSELKTRAEQLLNNSDDAIAFIADGIIMRCNDTFAENFGYSIEQLDCASIIDLVSDEEQNKFKNFFKMFNKGDLETAELNFSAIKQDKTVFDVFMSLTNSNLEGEPCNQVTITTTAQNNGTSSGIMDSATELFNRYYLTEQITTTALQVNNGGTQASLLVFSLDNYSTLLSDIYLSGIDALIKDLANVLKAALPNNSLIARLGDDSVAVILDQRPELALKKATELLTAIEKHICEYEQRTLQYTCACSVLHLNNKNSLELLDNAIECLYDIRLKKGKNSAAIFVPSTKEVASIGSNDIANIDEAIEHGIFKLLYQPLMSLQGSSKENYEVTLCMLENDKNVYPTALIQAAKSSKIDRWIIVEATKALAMHRANGHNTRLIINLTMNALLDDGLVAWLKVAIKAANLTNDFIIFQFDEEDIRNNLKSAIKTISTLRDSKFLIASRNFGKDKDPFKLLTHIKLDLIRFDTHFTDDIAKNDTVELKKLIGQAKENTIETLIAGVDNAGALATLWQLGIHYIQGSYLQKPSPTMNYEFTDLG